MSRLMQELIEEAGWEPRKYSGRGMLGAECLGADPGPSLYEFVADLVKAARNVEDDGEGRNSEAALDALEDALRRMRTDAMGHGTVAYFPGVPWDGGPGGKCEDCGKELTRADRAAYAAEGGGGDPRVCEDCAEGP